MTDPAEKKNLNVKYKMPSKWIRNVPDLVKLASLIFLAVVVITAVFSSTHSVKFLSNRIAKLSRIITESYKAQGMETSQVESSINLGFVKFKVIGIDKKM